MNHAIQQYHEVLIQISLGYPSVLGRFHTRYAPVRRSPSDCKQSMLPLDLHVLSLPLAFILSQDQTLHRCSLIIFELRKIILYFSKDVFAYVFYHYFVSKIIAANQYVNELLILLFLYTFILKAGANIKPFFHSHKTFLRFFLKLFCKLLASYIKYRISKNFAINVPVFSGCKHTTFFYSQQNLF